MWHLLWIKMISNNYSRVRGVYEEINKITFRIGYFKWDISCRLDLNITPILFVGKLDLVIAVADEKIKIKGDIEKAMLLKKFIEILLVLKQWNQPDQATDQQGILNKWTIQMISVKVRFTNIWIFVNLQTFSLLQFSRSDNWRKNGSRN